MSRALAVLLINERETQRLIEPLGRLKLRRTEYDEVDLDPGHLDMMAGSRLEARTRCPRTRLKRVPDQQPANGRIAGPAVDRLD